jgi:tyrosinase
MQAGVWLLILMRSLVLLASTIIVLFITWVLLHLIWSRSDEAVTITPFVVIDPSGNLKNADNGFAQILAAQMAELQNRILSARAVLAQAASGQSIVSQTEDRRVEALRQREGQDKPTIPDQPWPKVQASATAERVELKVQGVDIGGLVSWIRAQLIPERKGLAFTAHIASDGAVTIAGDVRDMNIDGVSNIYQSKPQHSPIAALNDLALQLFQLRLVSDDPHLRYLPVSEFGTLIERLSDATDTRIASRPDAERRKRYKDLSTYFAETLKSHADWPAMVILAAETARRGGDYSSALKYFVLAERQRQTQTSGPTPQISASLLSAAIASLQAPAAAYNRMNNKQLVAGEPVVRRVIDDTDVGAVEKLRAAFHDLYSVKDGDGYSAVAGLHGVPGWYSWNHQQNARSTENYRLYLPWYRAFLASFEQAARIKTPTFSLQCWDWTKGGIPTSFSETRSKGDQLNPLAAYNINLPEAAPPIARSTKRDPARPDELPTAADVSNVLTQTDWTNLADFLEDIGDQVHGWVSGDMGVIGTTAYDPLFYAHQCNIDRIWATWQKTHAPLDGPAAIDPELLDIVLDPFGVTVRDVLDTRKLGYVYE